MAEPDKMLEPEDGAGPVIDVHGRKLERAHTLPQGDHGQHRLPQIGQQSGLVLQVAHHDEGVAVTSLEDRRKGESFLPAALSTDNDVVATVGRLDGERLDRVGEERVAEAVSYTHLRAHETRHDLVCRLL